MPERILHETERFALIASTCGDPMFSPSLVIRWENGVRVEIPMSEIACSDTVCPSSVVHTVNPCEGIRICWQFERLDPDIEEGSGEDTNVYAAVVNLWIAEFTPNVCVLVAPDDLFHWKIKLHGNNLCAWTWERTEVDSDDVPIGKPRVIPESEARRLEELHAQLWVKLLSEQPETPG